MRRSLISAAMALMLVTPALAQDGSTELVARYERDHAATLELVADLTPEQWNYRTAADRWSIAEILEHVTLSEKFV